MKSVRPQSLVGLLGSLLPAVLVMACASSAPAPPSSMARAATPAAPASSSIPVPPLCPQPAPCGDHCSNTPYMPTDCWTTSYGPAKADVIVAPDTPTGSALSSTNMLYCNGGTYALCFFSGPPRGSGPQPLPCILKGDVADCTCQVYTSGAYFVDINAILNLNAYYETVRHCGADGQRCQNIVNCGTDGSGSYCGNYSPAPVCQYIQNQSPTNPAASLYPKGDVISAFSLAMSQYQIGSTPCTGRYAGCMTAPCFYKPGAKMPPSNGDPIQCECPLATGPYQVGQNGQACDIGGRGGSETFLWSAARTVKPSGSQP